jgi:aryl-alcohol dehydrogenase-like predicted oxidoreductase
MRMRPLGRTGLLVSELCLGTMTFGGGEGMWRSIGALDQSQAENLVARAIEAGINIIDTADVYAEGLSEQITGQALRSLKIPRDDVVIATKAFGQMGKGANARGNTRAHLISAATASLKRLQLEHIDLYQIHGFDPATPIEETVRALDTLVQHGHVRYVGVSNWAAWQIVKALGISEREFRARFQSVQAYYSIAGRDLERDIVPAITHEGLGLLVWSPLAGGLLSGKYQPGEDAADGRRAKFAFPPVDGPRGNACIGAMRPIAEAHGVSVARVALAWLLHRGAVTSVIVGAKRLDQLNDNIAAADLMLSAEELDLLDAVSALPPEYPGWMFERQGEGRRKQLADSIRADRR